MKIILTQGRSQIAEKTTRSQNGFSDAPVFRGLDIAVSRAIKLSSSPFVLRDNNQWIWPLQLESATFSNLNRRPDISDRYRVTIRSVIITGAILIIDESSTQKGENLITMSAVIAFMGPVQYRDLMRPANGAPQAGAVASFY